MGSSFIFEDSRSLARPVRLKFKKKKKITLVGKPIYCADFGGFVSSIDFCARFISLIHFTTTVHRALFGDCFVKQTPVKRSFVCTPFPIIDRFLDGNWDYCPEICQLFIRSEADYVCMAESSTIYMVIDTKMSV